MKRWILAGIAAAAVLSVGLVLRIPGASGGRDDVVVSGIGEVTIGGRTAHVEVFISVADGRTAADEVRAELIRRGARPLGASEYVASGLVWNQFSDASTSNDFMVQNYNGGSASTAPDPTGGGGLTALLNTHATWNDVATSKFAFSYGGTTTRCPSLVQECPGSQVFDGLNDVAWLDLGRCSPARCTLGVTWYATSDPDEADMALNTSVAWRTNGTNYDVETVMLHENGHALGLSHSALTQAVMYAYYGGVRRSLHADDIAGVSALYPDSSAPVATATNTPIATNTPVPGPATSTPTASCPPGWQKQGRC